MNGVATAGGDDGPPQTIQSCTNGAPINSCEDSLIDLECELECAKPMTQEVCDDVKFSPSASMKQYLENNVSGPCEQGERELVHDYGEQKESVNANSENKSEEVFEKLINYKFQQLEIDSDIQPRRVEIYGEIPRDHLENNPESQPPQSIKSDQELTPQVFRKPNQRLPVPVRPPRTSLSNVDVKGAMRSDWKWHGTPRPTKPLRSQCYSDSSAGMYSKTSREETLSKNDDDVFKTPVLKVKPSSNSKIPVSCPSKIPKYNRKMTPNLASRTSKL